jgi:hypothetical protein
LVAVVLVVGCGGNSPGPKDLATQGNQDLATPPDLATPDLSAAPADLAVSMTDIAIASPTVTYPAASATIVSPLTLQGTGIPNATINVQVLNGATVIGSGSATADGTGTFNFTSTFTQPASTTALTVSVAQTQGASTSSAVTVAVTQGVAGIFQFGANQNSGATTGTKVYVQVFATGASALPLQSQSFTVTAGVNSPEEDATFTLPAAGGGTTYYFMTFRDTNGDGLLTAGEPAINGGTRVTDLVMQGTNTPDGWTMM